MPIQRFKTWRLPAVLLTAVMVSGCATLSGDAGFKSVQGAAKERGLKQDAAWIRDDQSRGAARASIRKLLEAPLDLDAAVQIALLNNRGLQATYADVGIAEADVVQPDARLDEPLAAMGVVGLGDADRRPAADAVEHAVHVDHRAEPEKLEHWMYNAYDNDNIPAVERMLAEHDQPLLYECDGLTVAIPQFHLIAELRGKTLDLGGRNRLVVLASNHDG